MMPVFFDTPLLPLTFPIRLLVCGDRHWRDYAFILESLRTIGPERITVVIEGEAPGADQQSRYAAKALGILVERYPASWCLHGKAAGPIRNLKMLAEGQPDFVLAFHDDISTSKGTAHMLKIAREAGVPSYVLSHARPQLPKGLAK